MVKQHSKLTRTQATRIVTINSHVKVYDLTNCRPCYKTKRTAMGKFHMPGVPYNISTHCLICIRLKHIYQHVCCWLIDTKYVETNKSVPPKSELVEKMSKENKTLAQK